MTDIRVVFATIPEAEADAFVRTLCEERLVACGNIIGGVRSHYWWEGELQADREAVVWMETAADRLDAALARMRALHPYECPKLVAFDPAMVTEDYASWAVDQTRPPTK